jgi:PAS domain-containing protein
MRGPDEQTESFNQTHKRKMTMSGLPVPSVKTNEAYRMLPAIAGLVGIFILDMQTPLGIAVWIGYVFPVWYVGRLALRPSSSLPLFALASTGLIVAGYFLSLPGIPPVIAAFNRTMGVLCLWVYTFLSMRTRAGDDRLKGAQESLQQSEARLSGIISSAIDAIITVDEAQRVTGFNNAAEQMFGWAATDAVGQSIDRFIPQRFWTMYGHHGYH